MQNNANKSPIDLKDLRKGDVFSEISHYTFESSKVEGRGASKKTIYTFTHQKSGRKVTVGENYVAQLMNSANIYSKEEEV